MVRGKMPVVIWSIRATQQFRNAYDWIKQDSPANAEKVRTTIVKMIDNLPEHPEKYPPDKFKKNNKGNYRAFEKYSYRVAYKHTEKEIIILRFRHVKQEPKSY